MLGILEVVTGSGNSCVLPYLELIFPSYVRHENSASAVSVRPQLLSVHVISITPSTIARGSTWLKRKVAA